MNDQRCRSSGSAYRRFASGSTKLRRLEGDAFTDEIRAEAATLQTEYRGPRDPPQAAIVAEGEAETRANEGPDAERARAPRASIPRELDEPTFTAALSGRQVSGAEAELRDAAGIGDGIPLELWDVTDRGNRETRRMRPRERRGPLASTWTGSGPQVFANSIAPRLGIEMPRVSNPGPTLPRRSPRP